MSLKSRIGQVAEETFSSIADDSPGKGPLERALQTTFGVVAPVYGAAAWTSRLLHEAGVLKRDRLPAIVLSVGNLTLGGTGKTPFCIWLARFLQQKGRVPAVLTRGYGRDEEDRLVLVHDGKKLRATVRQAGDEPVFLARRLESVPVAACSNRNRAGRALLQRFEIDTFVLDDGFQHVSLDRQGDIVLLDATKPLNSLKVFPRGTLREPLGALERAHLLVLTRCDDRAQTGQAVRFLKSRYPGVPIVRTRMDTTGVLRLRDGKALGAAALHDNALFVASAVGNPASVRLAVGRAGGRVVREIRLPDHALPTKKDVANWERARRRAGAAYIVVTDKDAVKLREMDGLPGSFVSLRISLGFVNAKDEALAQKVVMSRIRAGALRGYLK